MMINERDCGSSNAIISDQKTQCKANSIQNVMSFSAFSCRSYNKKIVQQNNHFSRNQAVLATKPNSECSLWMILMLPIVGMHVIVYSTLLFNYLTSDLWKGSQIIIHNHRWFVSYSTIGVGSDGGEEGVLGMNRKNQSHSPNRHMIQKQEIGPR